MRKCSKDLSLKNFILFATKENWRPSQKCGAVSLETLHEDPTVRTVEVCDKQADWNYLLGKISRTAPDRLCGSYKSVAREYALVYCRSRTLAKAAD